MREYDFTNTKELGGIISDLCHHLLGQIEQKKHEEILIYHNQLVRQIISAQELEFEFCTQSLSKILEGMESIAKYTKEAQPINIGFLLSLQTELSSSLYKINTNDKEKLGDIKTLVNSHIGDLIELGINKNNGSKFIFNVPQPKNLLDAINHKSEALNTSEKPEEIAILSSDLDQVVQKYVRAQAHSILEDYLERRTFTPKTLNCPQLFIETVERYLKLYLSSDANHITKKVLYNASYILEIAKNKKRQPPGKNYSFSIDDLNCLEIRLGELLLRCEENRSQSYDIINWRKNKKRLLNILHSTNTKKDPLEKQKFLSSSIQNMLSDMLKKGEEILGPPPCNYAVLSLGSISRDECFTRSDLEFLIVLDDYKPFQREYFTCLAKLLQVQIVALGQSKAGFGLDGSDAANDPHNYIIHIDKLEEVCLGEGAQRQDITKELLPNRSYVLLNPSLLYTNDVSLFTKYEEKISSMLEAARKEQAILQLKEHIDKYFSETTNALKCISLEAETIEKRNQSIDIKTSVRFKGG